MLYQGASKNLTRLDVLRRTYKATRVHSFEWDSPNPPRPFIWPLLLLDLCSLLINVGIGPKGGKRTSCAARYSRFLPGNRGVFVELSRFSSLLCQRSLRGKKCDAVLIFKGLLRNFARVCQFVGKISLLILLYTALYLESIRKKLFLLREIRRSHRNVVETS